MDVSINKKGEKKSFNITRVQFEEALKKKFEKGIKAAVDKVFKQTKMNKKNIDEVVLVGGSTRIPYIRELVKTITGKNAKTDIDPDLAIAHGAALQAAALAGVE